MLCLLARGTVDSEIVRGDSVWINNMYSQKLQLGEMINSQYVISKNYVVYYLLKRGVQLHT